MFLRLLYLRLLYTYLPMGQEMEIGHVATIYFHE